MPWDVSQACRQRANAGIRHTEAMGGMKVIDWRVIGTGDDGLGDGTTVRYYLGDDALCDWHGDDWDDVPYEHNAGTVYYRFVTGRMTSRTRPAQSSSSRATGRATARGARRTCGSGACRSSSRTTPSPCTTRHAGVLAAMGRFIMPPVIFILRKVLLRIIYYT